MIFHSPRVDRIRCRRPDELPPVFERDWQLGADAIAIHRRKERRQPESPVRRRERTVAVAASQYWQRHLENNVPAVDRSLIAKKSCHHPETRDIESHPTSARTASRVQPEFHRPNALPSAATAVLRACVNL